MCSQPSGATCRNRSSLIVPPWRRSSVAVLRLITSSNRVRLLDRQIGRLGALDDLVHEHRSLAIEIRLPGAVGHQSSRIDEIPDPREWWQKMLERYRDTAILVRHGANV
jgi:hypothetical protein